MAEDNAKQVRKTLAEQEVLRKRLHEQKEQSDADSQWLQSSLSENEQENQQTWVDGVSSYIIYTSQD